MTLYSMSWFLGSETEITELKGSLREGKTQTVRWKHGNQKDYSQSISYAPFDFLNEVLDNRHA